MHLKTNAVTSAKVKDRSIRGADVVSAQIQLRVGESCPEGQAIRVINVTGGVLCEVDDRGGSGGGSPSGPAGGDLAGSYPNPSIRDAAVDSATVANGSLTGDDISDNRLSGSDILNNSLTGDDVDEATLGRVPSALLGGWGRSGATTTCDPPKTGDFVPCAATEILNVPAGARALVFGRTQAVAYPGEGYGFCRLSASSTGPIPNTQVRFSLGSFSSNIMHATLVGVTPPLPAGATSFGIECSETVGTKGGIDHESISASVVLIAGA